MWVQFERFALNITKKQAQMGSHQGQCDKDVAYLCELPAIRRQLNKLDPAMLNAELKEYGAWDDEQRADHEENKRRIVWIACGNLLDELSERSKR